MKYDFDEIINRRNSRSSKWDNVGVRIGNPQALPMWAADMDFKCPQPVIDAVIERAQHGIYGYPFIDKDFSTAIKNWVKKRHGWAIENDWVLFSPGINPALNAIVQTFTAVDDEVILLSPGYRRFQDVTIINGRKVIKSVLKLGKTQYEIDFMDIEAKVKRKKARLMFLCNPHNPIGRVFNLAELTRIARICIENNIIIVSDEAHSDLIFSGYRHIPIASISKQVADITITAMSPSKAFNISGLRISSIVISNNNMKRAMENHFDKNRTSIVSLFGLPAYITAYCNNECESYLKQLILYIQKNINFVDGYFKENISKIRLIKPEGTYLAWLDCRRLGMTKDELDDFFINKSQVALRSGHWFGDEGIGFMRLNLACPRAIIEQALHQIYQQYINL